MWLQANLNLQNISIKTNARLKIAWLKFLTIFLRVQAICSKNIRLRDLNRDQYLFDQISLPEQNPPTTPLTCINFCKLWFSSKTVKTIFKFGKYETKNNNYGILNYSLFADCFWNNWGEICEFRWWKDSFSKWISVKL